MMAFRSFFWRQASSPAPALICRWFSASSAPHPLPSSSHHSMDHIHEQHTPHKHSKHHTQMTMVQALNVALREEMERDGDVFLMGENVGVSGGAHKVSRGLWHLFGGGRVIDTPISEIGFSGLGVGAAMAGGRPIIEFMTFNFSLQAIDHIINSAAKTCYMSAGRVPVPIVFRGPNGFAPGVAGQHTQCFSAWYASVPGLKVLTPYSAKDAKGLLKSAIRDPDPVVFLENEVLYDVPFDMDAESASNNFLIPIGQAQLEYTGIEGTEPSATLVSYSRGVGLCLEAAKQLAEAGVSVEVINLRSLRPLDMTTIVTSLSKTGRLILVEEAWPVCGISAEISARVCENPATFAMLKSPVTRISCADMPTPYAKNYEQAWLPQPANIVRAVQKGLGALNPESVKYRA